MAEFATMTVTNNLFPRIAQRFPGAAAQATNAAMARTVEVADPLARVDTGLMRANKAIRAATAGDPSGEIHWTQAYTGHQEFGTSRGISPNRFIRRGVQAGTELWLIELGNIEGKLV